MKIIIALLFIANLILGYLGGAKVIPQSVINLLCVIVGCAFSYCMKELQRKGE